MLNRKLFRRAGSTLLVAASVLGLSLVGTQPAQAVGYGGDVTNNLPSSWPVKIAKFGVGGSHFCNTQNSGSLTCTEYWLPSGQSDSDLRGFWFDTDGFKVENVSRYYVSNYGWVPGNVWFRISDLNKVHCSRVNGSPYCLVDIV
ncbi:hypothetical protein ACFWN2_02505 [Lentzea sp. NPDC058436]|uniref:hypothetical protein n=1 Tax=Lentzea sp. NPDC058436 TaxID=3346499 RepID=UPI003647EFC6